MTTKNQNIVDVVKAYAFPVLVGVVLFFGRKSLINQEKAEQKLSSMETGIAVLNTRMETVVKVQDEQAKDIRSLLFKAQLATGHKDDSILNHFGTNFVSCPIDTFHTYVSLNLKP